MFLKENLKKNGILLIRGNSHLSSFVILSNNKRRAILDVNIRRRGKLGKIVHRSLYSSLQRISDKRCSIGGVLWTTGREL